MNIGVSPDEGADGLGISAIPSCKRHVWHEGAPFRLKADLLQGTFDLGGQRDDGFPWLNSRPQGAAVSLFELADALDSKVESQGAETVKRARYVVRHGPFNLTDEPERQVQLFVADPAQRRTVVHGVDQEIADLLWRADGDEKTMHWRDLGPWTAGV